MSVFEITYTYFKKERPIVTVTADNAEKAREGFKAIKPAVPDAEILGIREIVVSKIDEERRQQRIENGKNKISKLQPETIDDVLLVYLESVREDVKLRFSWPAEVHDAVIERFKELMIPMPADVRPMDSGKFGGEPMYGLSTELSYPAPQDSTSIPEGARLSENGKRIEISRVTFSTGLRKAGFPVNVYTKQTP